MRRTLEGVGVSHLRKDAHRHRPHRHAEPRPCNLGNGIFITDGYLVVLADDAGRRALPVWLRGHPGGRSLSELLGRADSELVTGGVPEELAARLLHAAGATVTGVDIDVTAADADELDPDACTALVQLGGPAGPGQIPVPFGLGLAVAAEAGAPVWVADRVLDGGPCRYPATTCSVRSWTGSRPPRD